MSLFLCPVCERHHFEAENDFDYCPICGWQNDGVQAHNPDLSGGANLYNVNDSRLIYKVLSDSKTMEQAKQLQVMHKARLKIIDEKGKSGELKSAGDWWYRAWKEEYEDYLHDMKRLYLKDLLPETPDSQIGIL